MFADYRCIAQQDEWLARQAELRERVSGVRQAVPTGGARLGRISEALGAGGTPHRLPLPSVERFTARVNGVNAVLTPVIFEL
ncbi:hypothetical protein [Paraburkholderia mimosarum]|uniref:hypothetical protein n=1 Tax=Paraburkholderia mimosarum TaxID=312026 RepID=UPI0012DD2795|nr:hypothetical protein [Paraburkholderia mimosarum]